jgi:glycosyltransferase involved in cell wall biosynthesis
MLHFIWTPYKFRQCSWSRYERANDEIVKHARRFFEARIATHVAPFYAGRLTDRLEDILLGHPTWDAENDGLDDWVAANALQPGASAHPNTYIMTPWVPEFPPEWKMPHLATQLAAARRVFGLCGEIWAERTRSLQDGSLAASVASKLVRVNMGCAAALLPFRAVPRPGPRRGLLHISNMGGYKRFDLLLRSIAGLDLDLHVASPMVKPGTIDAAIAGRGHVQVNSLGEVHNGHPGFEAFVRDRIDFYIHTSDMDAQATVVLEAAARGIVPIVTPESGFRSPFAIELTDDPDRNQAIIADALQMPDAEYSRRAAGLRAQIEREHDWNGIFGQVWDVIAADCGLRPCLSAAA